MKKIAILVIVFIMCIVAPAWASGVTGSTRSVRDSIKTRRERARSMKKTQAKFKQLKERSKAKIATEETGATDTATEETGATDTEEESGVMYIYITEDGERDEFCPEEGKEPEDEESEKCKQTASGIPLDAYPKNLKEHWEKNVWGGRKWHQVGGVDERGVIEAKRKADADIINREIEHLKNIPWGKTPDGRAIINIITQMNEQGRIFFADILQGTVTGGYQCRAREIILDPEAIKLSTKDRMASVLAHEALHAYLHSINKPYDFINERMAFDYGYAVAKEMNIPGAKPVTDNKIKRWYRRDFEQARTQGFWGW